MTKKEVKKYKQELVTKIAAWQVKSVRVVDNEDTNRVPQILKELVSILEYVQVVIDEEKTEINSKKVTKFLLTVNLIKASENIFIEESGLKQYRNSRLRKKVYNKIYPTRYFPNAKIDNITVLINITRLTAKLYMLDLAAFYYVYLLTLNELEVI